MAALAATLLKPEHVSVVVDKVNDVAKKVLEHATPMNVAALGAAYYAGGMLNEFRKASAQAAIDARPGMKKRVGIIGAGASGLTVMKELQDEGHEFVCYEKYEELGGVFYYKEEGKGGVYNSTMLTISNYFMAFSDFPPQNEDIHHWMRQEYEDYLHAYAKKHDLRKFIKMRHEVVLMEREPGTTRWILEVKQPDGTLARDVFDAIAICNGTHQQEKWPELPGRENFDGEIMHTSVYKTPESFAGKHVVTIGCGESATDLIKEISDFAISTYASIRRPPIIIPRYPEETHFTNDMYTSRFHHFPNNVLFDFLVNVKYIYQKHFHHCPKYRKVAEFALQSGGGESRQFLTKNENFVTNVVNGKVVVKPGIKKLHRDRVYFLDGSSVKCDVLMVNTGYKDVFPFLKCMKVDDVRELFRHAWHPALGENVAFIGWVRPSTGAIPVCSEFISRAFSLILAGKRSLPKGWGDMIRKEADWENHRFNLSAPLRTLVNYGRFAESMAEIIGCKPNLRWIFLTNPKLWYHMWFGPHYSFQYRLRGPHPNTEESKRVIMKYAPNPWRYGTIALVLGIHAITLLGHPFGIFPATW